MATFIDLDSIWRDRDTYPNACDYEVLPEQIKTWFRQAREVRAYPQNTNTRPQEFVTTVNIALLTLPFNEQLSILPRIYVDFHCRRYDDRYLISTIGGRQPEARFICILDRIQFDIDNITPLWIHYKSPMEQTLRFLRDDPVVFRITDRNGTVLPFFIDDDPTQPADPTQQSMVTFTITPYIRDSTYDNHAVAPII